MENLKFKMENYPIGSNRLSRQIVGISRLGCQKFFIFNFKF